MASTPENLNGDIGPPMERRPKYRDPGHNPWVAPETFDQLVHEYDEYLKGVVRKFAPWGDEEDLNDIFVEGLLYALRCKQRYDPRRNAKGKLHARPVRYATYLVQGTWNKVKQHRKKKFSQREKQSPLDNGRPLDELIDYRSPHTPTDAHFRGESEKRELAQSLAHGLKPHLQELLLRMIDQTLAGAKLDSIERLATHFEVSSRTVSRWKKDISDHLGEEGRVALENILMGGSP